MLTIRKEQLIALRQLRDIKLQDDFLEHFRKSYTIALAARGDEELKSIFAQAIAQARQFGLTRTRSYAEFAARCLFVDPEFYKQPEYADALDQIRRDPDPDTRFLLLDSLKEQQRI